MTSSWVYLRMVVIVSLIALIFLPVQNEALLLPPSQSGFYMDTRGNMVVTGEIGNPYPDKRTVTFPNVTAYIFGPNPEVPFLETDSFYSKFNLPYYAKLPVRIEMNPGITDVKGVHISSERFHAGIDKPANLVVLSSNLEKLDGPKGFTKWKVEIKLLNNATMRSTETYVMVALHDSDGKVVDAIADNVPFILEPKQSKSVELEDILPSVLQPTSVYVYAESKEGTTYYKNMFPLRQKITFRSEQGGYLENMPIVGDKVVIRNDLFNYIQSNMKFWQIIQVSRILDLDQPINLESNRITVEIIKTQVRIEEGKPWMTNVTWVPDEEGYYVMESFLWSDLDIPVPLSPTYIGFGLYIDTTLVVRTS